MRLVCHSVVVASCQFGSETVDPMVAVHCHLTLLNSALEFVVAGRFSYNLPILHFGELVHDVITDKARTLMTAQCLE